MERSEELEQGINLIYTKLGLGTMHVPYCNADPDGPVGGDMCCCPPGREIKNLRHAIKEMFRYVEHHRFCEVTYTDFCTCGLIDALRLARQVINAPT